MKTHRAFILADTHGGSIWGLMKPIYQSTHGGITSTFNANITQLSLYKSFKKMEKKVARRNIKTLFLNGDMVDGAGYRSRKGELFSEDLNDQVYMMAEILSEFIGKVKPEVIYQLSGSDYHTSRQMDLERVLAKEIGAEYLGLGPYDFDFGDLKVNIEHGAGSVYWYRGTKMDKILFALNLCKADSALYDADVVIRNHYHFAGFLEFPPRQYILIAPCWQAQTDYMRQKDPFKLVPTIGSLEITVRGTKFNHRWYLYEHPPRPKVHLTGVSADLRESKKKRHIERW